MSVENKLVLPYNDVSDISVYFLFGYCRGVSDSSILKDQGMYQTKCAVCIKRQSQSQLIVRSAVITSVMSVLLCGRDVRCSLL